MTGYLHIPTVGLRDKIALALDTCCQDCALDPDGAQQRNAENVLRVLRGLSVEPTEHRTVAKLLTVDFDPDEQNLFEPPQHIATFQVPPTDRWGAGDYTITFPVAPVPVQEDQPTCEHGKTGAHWYPNPHCVERWPDCISCGYDPRCCRFPKSCSADERCDGPAAKSEDSALVVQEDRI